MMTSPQQIKENPHNKWLEKYINTIESNSNNSSMNQYSLGGLTPNNSDPETRALVESRF